MYLQDKQQKAKVVPLLRSLHNFKTWQESVTRYLQKEGARHLVHSTHNVQASTNDLDEKRPLHTIMRTQRTRKCTPSEITPKRDEGQMQTKAKTKLKTCYPR